MTEVRLSDHDALLVNLAGIVLVAPLLTAGELEADVGWIAEVLPRVSRDHVRMRDLAAACEALVAALPARTSIDGAVNGRWHRAVFDAGLALEAVLRWRAVQLQAKLGKVAAR